jgi:hypothetical protein
MRKVIDGKIYDTETATKICFVGNSGYQQNDFHYDDSDLYVTKSGAYFIAGEGGALSRWGRAHGQSGRIGGDGIVVIDADQAAAFAQSRLDADEYLKFFPAVEA